MVGSYTLYLFIYAKNYQNTYVVKITGPYDYFVRIINRPDNLPDHQNTSRLRLTSTHRPTFTNNNDNKIYTKNGDSRPMNITYIVHGT